MKSKNIKASVAQFLCNILPPFLAYRVHEAFFSDLISSNVPFRQKALFGSSEIQSTMSDYISVNFALHRTINFIGMAVASELIRRGDVVFELGANIGTETLALSNLVGAEGKVIAIEASPYLAEILGCNLNFANVKNVLIVNKAVAANNGVMSVFHGLESNLGASYVSDGIGASDIYVSAITVDELVTEFGSPSFVFMDIEGSEYGFLKGGLHLLSVVRPVIFSEIVAEYLPRSGGTISDFCRILSDHSYAAFDANSRRLDAIDYSLVDNGVCSDWLLVPNEKIDFVVSCRRLLLRARTMPRIGKLNPLDFIP